MTDTTCVRDAHAPDCALVESYDGLRFRECTRCEGCGALPGEMCWCGWPPGGAS